ncbi:MAG TPA: electron transport complex subunit E [Candidatus Spyradocola merdavium]|nr:electron transport complex subunit E [Candidatus Spyradocola merdavium]
MAKQDLKKIFLNGIVTENPTFRLVLGMCPTLAITTSVLNGLGMGLATTFVLVCSNFVISLIRNFVPSKVRIPAYIVVIATFVTIVQLLLEAFLPSLSQSLGLFIPLIVVNCIIFARAESFASKNPPLASMADGLGMGLGFTISLSIISAVRELIGSGTLLGFPVLGSNYPGVLLFILAPGGYITLGLVMVAFNAVMKKIDGRRRAAAEGSVA